MWWGVGGWGGEGVLSHFMAVVGKHFTVAYCGLVVEIQPLNC